MQVPHGRSLWAPQQADPHAFGGFGPPMPRMAAPMMRCRATAPGMMKKGGGGERMVLVPLLANTLMTTCRPPMMRCCIPEPVRLASLRSRSLDLRIEVRLLRIG